MEQRDCNFTSSEHWYVLPEITLGNDGYHDYGTPNVLVNNNAYGVSLFLCRRSMAIVPQSPPLFTGTIRQNLDPFTEHSDARIWSALRSCYVDTALATAVNRLRRRAQSQSDNDQTRESCREDRDSQNDAVSEQEYLNCDMAEVGKSLAHGERQLLVLARALLTQAKVSF